MNYRNMWKILSLGALGITLVALPGSSRATQENSKTPKVKSDRPQAEVDAQPLSSEELRQQAEQLRDTAMALANAYQEVAPDMQILDDSKDSQNGDLQVLLGSENGWLGVGVAEVSADNAKTLKLPEERGALLDRIVPESPAAKAGLKENDVVLAINGQRVEGTEQFRRMIREIPPGRTANLTIWRDGHTQNVKVTLAKPEASDLHVFLKNPKVFKFKMPDVSVMPDLSGLEQLRSFRLVSPGHPILGIDAESIEGDFGNYFGAPDGEGILVREVFSDSPAAKAGLKVGDVITSMNGERVRSASELREKLLTRKDDKAVKLGILRNKAEMTLSVELPQHKDEVEHFFSDRTQI